MPGWLVSLCLGGVAIIAFACNDELVEDVPKDVCYSEKRWIGDKRGSPEMFPGRDCVGCHIDNDGPPLAIGGTLYPYVLDTTTLAQAQSGEDCFGVEGILITIEDADGQQFLVETNRAGNFFVEGDPDDFAKPFTVSLPPGTNEEGVPSPQMFTQPSYGGCAKCHSPNATAFPMPGAPPDVDVPPDQIVSPQPPIGLPGYSIVEGITVENELRMGAGLPTR
jgi:hypothetical protein